MTARSIGSATVAFGLVSIPIKLYTTNETTKDIHFNLLHEADGARVKQVYHCTKCDEVVDREHMVKGYEHAPGQYVVITSDEQEALDAVATETIAIDEFVLASAVDSLWIEKSYYLGPDKGGDKAYKLIRDAMVETDLVGIASYSARGKQYLVCLRPFKDGLMMNQLRYAAEVKDWAEVPIPEMTAPARAELDLAKQIMGQIVSTTFNPAKYVDNVQERMRALLDQKVAGQEIVIEPTAKLAPIIDLVAALKASIDPAKLRMMPPSRKATIEAQFTVPAGATITTMNPGGSHTRQRHDDNAKPKPSRSKSVPKRTSKSRAARAAAARRPTTKAAKRARRR